MYVAVGHDIIDYIYASAKLLQAKD